MDHPSLLISAGSMLVAILSLTFSIRAWRETYRPLVTVRISSRAGGNLGVSLNILVENSGARPALDVQLTATDADVKAAMADDCPEQPIPRDAQRVFFSGIRIPVLANGRTTSNAFGWLGSSEPIWRAGASLPEAVRYRGMDRTRYVDHCALAWRMTPGSPRRSGKILPSSSGPSRRSL